MRKRLRTGRFLALDLLPPPMSALNYTVTNTNYSGTGSRSARAGKWRG